MTEYTQVHSAVEESRAEEHEGGHAHTTGYGTYIMVWLGLVALTAITVTIAGIHLGSLTLIMALLIACIKTTLVAYHFMHVKFDDRIIKIFIFVCIGIFLTFWILTFSDLSFT